MEEQKFTIEELDRISDGLGALINRGPKEDGLSGFLNILLEQDNHEEAIKRHKAEKRKIEAEFELEIDEIRILQGKVLTMKRTLKTELINDLAIQKLNKK